MSAESSSHRLPTNVCPSRYDLIIVPDFDDFTFQGHVKITIRVSSETNTIVLNSHHLTYPSRSRNQSAGDGATETQILQPFVTLTSVHSSSSPSLSSLEAVSVSVDSARQRASFIFPISFSPGDYVLSILYSGEINDKLCGFYRSSYTRPAAAVAAGASPTGVFLCTQFQPTDARKAFPCWDEPASKAVFALTLIVPINTKDGKGTLTALGNGPVVKKELTAGSEEEKKQGGGGGGGGEEDPYEVRIPLMVSVIHPVVIAGCSVILPSCPLILSPG